MYSHITANKRKTWLLISLFIGFIIAIGWIFSQYFEFGPGAIIIAAVIAFSVSVFSYYRGDKVALATHGAKPVLQKENPYIYRLVENLCITAGTPVPKIYIIHDHAPNAFATGRDPQHASIALTTGIIERLENEELEGVIAHELSHIKNYDIRVMTLVVILVGLIALLSDFFLRMQIWGFGGRRHGGGQGQVLVLIIGIALAILSPIIAQLIQLAVSRKREFLADASGALLTRYPEGLANALKKINKAPRELARANHATAHLFFSSPFKNKKGFLNRLFMTHPPIEERIKQLQKMRRAET